MVSAEIQGRWRHGAPGRGQFFTCFGVRFLHIRMFVFFRKIQKTILNQLKEVIASSKAVFNHFHPQPIAGTNYVFGQVPASVPSSNLSEISELVSMTPWATDDTETLQRALQPGQDLFFCT